MDLVRVMEASNICRESSLHPNLPPEIITEILLRLPVRSLLKFECVCKSWLISISSSQFIKTHLDISTKSNNFSKYILILASYRSSETLYTCPLSSIFSNTIMDNSRAIDYHMSVAYYNWVFVGSCNGLLCVSIDREALVLYNPSIRKFKTLLVSGNNISHGFCYDEINDGFKVVQLNRVWNRPFMNSIEVKVYSLRNDSWRKIENDQDGLIYCCGGQSVGAILHWCMYPNDGYDGVYLIFAVNTMTNMHETLEPPKDDGIDGIAKLSLAELNGCLTVFYEYYKPRLDVWVMKEYGVKESWSKVVSIPYPANPSYYFRPLLVLEYAEFCVPYGPYMMLYNSRNNSFTAHQINNIGALRLIAVPPYIESLVDPNFLGE